MHRTRPLARLAAAATGLCLTATALPAAVLGLVVGVSDYEHLDADLRGPANDVGLVSRMLLARGAAPDDITILAAPGARVAEGTAVAGLPRRAAILDALARLARTATPGDTVVFYFSGHGSQMPDVGGDEAGGYDEIILPSDARNWRGSIGAVENALVDDELAVAMQAILDTGAALVAIIDACHSATGFRDPGSAPGAARYVDPAALGVPGAMTGDAHEGQVAPPLTGRFVFLYSSQSDQRSFEYPVGDREDPANWYGDFTKSLMPVLETAEGLTWSTALMAATDAMAKDGPAAQTPDAEGPLLDTPVFGTGSAAPLWRVTGTGVAAGLLHGLEPGAELAIFPDVEAAGEPVIATVTGAGADSATLDRPAEGYARLHRPALPAPLRLHSPVAADEGDYAALTGMLTEAARTLDGIELTEAQATMTAWLTGGTLALAGRDGMLDGDGPGSSPRLVAGADQAQVKAFLDRAVRLHRLRRALAAAEGAGGSGFALPGAGLKVTAEHRPAAACGETGAPAPVTAAIAARHCDQVWLAVANASKTARDVTVLYIDRDLGITPIWPAAGLSNRVAFGETAEIGLMIDNPQGAAGTEEIVVLAAPARQGAPRTVLTALADPVRMRAFGPSAPPLAEWLFAAADPEASTRNFSFGGALPSLEVTRLRIALVPGAP